MALDGAGIRRGGGGESVVTMGGSKAHGSFLVF